MSLSSRLSTVFLLRVAILRENIYTVRLCELITWVKKSVFMHLMVKRVKPPPQITLIGSHMMSYLSWKSSVLCQQYVFSRIVSGKVPFLQILLF